MAGMPLFQFNLSVSLMHGGWSRLPHVDVRTIRVGSEFHSFTRLLALAETGISY